MEAPVFLVNSHFLPPQLFLFCVISYEFPISLSYTLVIFFVSFFPFSLFFTYSSDLGDGIIRGGMHL